MQSLLETFDTKARAVGAEVRHCTNKTEALTSLLQILKDESVAEADGCYAVWDECPFLNGVDRKALEEQVPGLRFGVTRELAAQAKVGISQMEWAIADTGTVVQDASAVQSRLVSSLPPTHVALISSEKLLPDLPSALAKTGPVRAGYLAMITGPSRTADIERVLTIGVHGPSRFIVILFDGAEGAAQ